MATWRDVLAAVTAFEIRFEANLDARFRELERETHARFAILEKRFDRLKLPTRL